ncbi:MAG: trypsin-like peptidase domain-containing protein [SAR202 cluster bacterium]|nr:trypsin-like peptidase domain-containing protein [SAR202 cluster bacterium]
MKLILSIALSIFFIFPSYAYDEKIKLNRTDSKIISGETKIKVSLNKMLNFRKIKQINKKFASIENSVKKTSRKLKNRGRKTKFKGINTDDLLKATVYIAHEFAIGAGLIINTDGTILTNWHVIDGAKEIKVWLLPEDITQKEEGDLWSFQPFYIGKVIHMDRKKDLALIKIEDVPNNLKVIKFGYYKNMKNLKNLIGQTAHAIGHPKGLTWSFNSGHVNAIRDDYKWQGDGDRHRANVVQHQIPISPGNSGGPLLDNFGKLIGVNTFFRVDGQNLNFAVEINDIIEFLEAKHVVEDEKKPAKNQTWITKKCKEKKSYISKKCKDKDISDLNPAGVKKTYPDAKSSDANNNGTDDTWYVDTNNNGIIDTAFVDDDEDGIIEAVMIDDNENGVWESIVGDQDLDGNPDIAMIDRDEDGKGDVIAYDFNQDGEWDKFEEAS